MNFIVTWIGLNCERSDLLMKYLGFFTATVIFMFASLLYLKVPVLASVISVVSVNLLIYLAFVQFLGVRLPKGLLF